MRAVHYCALFARVLGHLLGDTFLFVKLLYTTCFLDHQSVKNWHGEIDCYVP